MTTSRNFSADGRWWFDENEAERACAFFPRMLTHVKGRRGPFNLEPWQTELVENIFGWKERGTNFRRYKTVYAEVPRKNGKTSMAAGILLYMLLVDKEIGAEVYSAATTREQAGLVYEIAAQMVTAKPSLASRVKRLDSKKRLVGQGDHLGSFFQACSSEAGAVHGTNPHCVIFDELHEQPDRKLWESFQTGFGSRDQPLFFSITTAGFDRSSICWEQHQYALAVQKDPGLDEQFLPVLFAAEPEDDWTDPKVWKKANPNLGVALKEDFLQRECAKAQEIPAMENGFRRLHLNQWTQQESRIIAMTSWDSCEVAIDWSEYDGRTCFAGLDLSSTRDVTAFVLAFPEDDGGVSVRPWFWIPEMNIDQRTGQDQRMVRNYADQGFIESTPGNEVDVIFLVERIMEICQNYDVRHLGYDPWNAVGVVQLLQSHGMPLHMLEKMNQGSSTYNEPFKRLLSWLGNGKYRHDGNAVLRWMAGNTSHREDANGNIRPDKGRSSDKIDGICAMLMACGLLINYGSEHGAYMEAGSGVVLF